MAMAVGIEAVSRSQYARERATDVWMLEDVEKRRHCGEDAVADGAALLEHRLGVAMDVTVEIARHVGVNDRVSIHDEVPHRAIIQ